MAEDFNTGDMLDVYLYENRQLLENLQDIVLEQKDADSFDEDSINEIFRTMHTIKGSSGIMMFDEITKISHKLEDVFYFLRESHPKNVPHQELIEHVLKVADFINAEMDKLSDGDSADGDASELVKELDEFLTGIKGGGKADPKKETAAKNDEPKQFYIAPAAASSSHYFKIYLTYDPSIQMASMHAYKTVHALKELADDIMYSPEDILTNENSSQEILDNGFTILIQTQKTEEDIRKLVQPGYDLKKVDVVECSQKDYRMGFDSVGTEIRIDLDSSVEEIEARKNGQQSAEAQKPAMAPGFRHRVQTAGQGEDACQGQAEENGKGRIHQRRYHKDGHAHGSDRGTGDLPVCGAPESGS
jgi:two-component system chemotaxis sensor kinase CheA